MKRFLFLFWALLLLTGCSGMTDRADAELSRSLPKQSVRIEDYTFSPATLTVPIGTTVQWTNYDPVYHSVVFSKFKSDKLRRGGAYAHIFSTAGTFEYHCGLHSSMKGTITVLK